MGKDEILKEVLSYARIIILSAAAAFLINHTLIVNAEVPTGSMESTVMTGSRIIVNRLAYLTKQPERGDIVDFHYPDDEKQLFLKRIIALPGERIEGVSGQVYINGEVLDEPYIKEQFRQDFGPYDVPSDSYFVMGDNRNNSLDSRYWNHKFVKRSAIIGRAEFEYFPKVKRLSY